MQQQILRKTAGLFVLLMLGLAHKSGSIMMQEGNVKPATKLLEMNRKAYFLPNSKASTIAAVECLPKLLHWTHLS